MIGRTIAAASIAGAIVLGPAAAAFGATDDYVAPSPSNSVLSENDTKSSGTLSSTGFESAPMALGAGVLLVAGAATVIVAARRTSTGTKS